ncbi:MAG: hypothetical protein MJ078_06235, partial [Clostridia bacterium]|nr:hypothetical protein [Clostridia bacterium]
PEPKVFPPVVLERNFPFLPIVPYTDVPVKTLYGVSRTVKIREKLVPPNAEKERGAAGFRSGVFYRERGNDE